MSHVWWWVLLLASAKKLLSYISWGMDFETHTAVTYLPATKITEDWILQLSFPFSQNSNKHLKISSQLTCISIFPLDFAIFLALQEMFSEVRSMKYFGGLPVMWLPWKQNGWLMCQGSNEDRPQGFTQAHSLTGIKSITD